MKILIALAMLAALAGFARPAYAGDYTVIECIGTTYQVTVNGQITQRYAGDPRCAAFKGGATALGTGPAAAPAPQAVHTTTNVNTATATASGSSHVTNIYQAPAAAAAPTYIVVKSAEHYCYADERPIYLECFAYPEYFFNGEPAPRLPSKVLALYSQCPRICPSPQPDSLYAGWIYDQP